MEKPLFRLTDVILLKQLQTRIDSNNDGYILFNSLTTEQKLALIPSASPRLVRFKLVEIQYNPDTFAPTWVSINQVMVEQYQEYLDIVGDCYVYLHRDPETKSVYIGKGQQDRAWGPHSKDLEVEILYSGLTESEAFLYEKIAINLCKKLGFLVTNKYNGGNGNRSKRNG